MSVETLLISGAIVVVAVSAAVVAGPALSNTGVVQSVSNSPVPLSNVYAPHNNPVSVPSESFGPTIVVVPTVVNGTPAQPPPASVIWPSASSTEPVRPLPVPAAPPPVVTPSPPVTTTTTTETTTAPTCPIGLKLDPLLQVCVTI